jgi:zinc/manganese transport system substrate-binding protein
MSFTGVIVLALLGVLASVEDATAKVRVAATTGTLAAIAGDVGGELVEVTALSAPTEDPHYVDARPNLVLTLNHADLLVATGLELEVGWLPNLQKSARNPEIGPGGRGYYEAHTALSHLAEVPTGRVDRAQGDIHAGGNPHYLYDPRAGAEVAIGLGTKLAELDPANAATYVTRAQSVAAKYRAVGETQRARFGALPAEKRRVVSYHASWPYLLDWLTLEQVETVEPKPGIAPSPAHVATVLQRMRATGAKAVLQEEFYPRGTSEKLSSLAGAKLVVVPGAVRFGTQTYPEFVGQIAEALHAALGG